LHKSIQNEKLATMSLEKHLILTGFMGAGKSTVGGEVAKKLGVPFYDNDVRIVARSGMAVKEIFARYGEEGFRRRERVAFLETLLHEKPGVIPTGGGFVSTEAGRQILLECGAPVVYLSAEFDTLAARVEADPVNIRPLFQNREQALGLLTVRIPWYAETATSVVDTENRPFEDIVKQVAWLAE
jgi:shikimate kinase